MGNLNQFHEPADSYWLKRWRVLDQSIAGLRTRLVQGGERLEEEPDFPARAAKDFDSLLGKLQSFLRKQFFFFYDVWGEGAAGDGADGGGAVRAGLARSDVMTPDHVFRQIIDQAAYDLTVIRLAAAQMAMGSPDELRTLAVAANMVKTFLDSLKWEDGSPAFLPSTEHVITYFQKGAAIRILPYADVVLIGIPPSAVESEQGRDLLALGHELGHYVYWNGFQFHNAPGALKGERLATVCDFMTSSRPAYIRRWQEEIFADVFGAVVTGNHAVLYSAQEMIRDNATHARAVDDSEHPIDAIRYVAYLAVLEFLNEQEGFELRIGPRAARQLAAEGKLTGRLLRKTGEPFAIPADADEEWPAELVVNGLRFDMARLVAEDFYAQFDYFVTEDSLGNRREIALDEAAGVLADTAKDICSFLWDTAPRMFGRWEAQFLDSGPEIVRLMTDLEAYSQITFGRADKRASREAVPDGPLVPSQESQSDVRFERWSEMLKGHYELVGEQQPLKVVGLSKEPTGSTAAVGKPSAQATLESTSSTDVPLIEDDSSERWFGWVRDTVRQQHTAMPAEAWKVVLSADGWADIDDRGGDTDAPRGVFER